VASSGQLPTVAILSDGVRLVAFWESENFMVDGKGVYGQVFDANGNLLGPEL